MFLRTFRNMCNDASYDQYHKPVSSPLPPHLQDDNDPPQVQPHTHHPETNLPIPHGTNLSIVPPHSHANTKVEDHDHQPEQEDQKIEPSKKESKVGEEHENVSTKESRKDKEFLEGFMKEVVGNTTKGEAEPTSPSPTVPFKWPKITDHPILTGEAADVKPDGRSNMDEHHNKGHKDEMTEGPATSHVTKIGDTWHYTAQCVH